MKQILILSMTDLASDPRVHRQIEALSREYRVLAAGTAPPEIDGVQYFAIPRFEALTLPRKASSAVLLGLGLYERYYWAQPQVRGCLSALSGVHPAVTIANDLGTLPLALKLDSRSGVILDAHEYTPREFEDRLTWRLFFRSYNDYLCREYLGRVAGMTTVCQSIADEYSANYRVAPEVVMNAPPYHDLRPGTTDPNAIRMVHHGGAIPSRRIEVMIELMDHLDQRFQLDLMLLPTDRRYFDQLRPLANTRSRVRIIPAVPMPELPQRLNRYDVGLYLLPPNSFNNLHALPNKFFEFVQARLALAIGPSTEMARLVRAYDCGIVADDFSPRSLAERLNRLDRAQIDYYKQRSHAAAAELCFEKNSTVLIDMIERLTGRS